MIPSCYHILNILTFEQVNRIDPGDSWALNLWQTNYSPEQVLWGLVSLYVASQEINMSKVGEIGITDVKTPNVPEGEVRLRTECHPKAFAVLEQCLNAVFIP